MDQSFLKKLDPFVLRKLPVGIQPAFERAIFFLQVPDLLRIDDRRVDLRPVADDTLICQQTHTPASLRKI